MRNYHSCQLILTKPTIRKMQRILDRLFNEIDERHRVSKENVVTLTQQSQQRLMNYKELYLHRDSIGEGEWQTAYENMTDVEKQFADMGILELTYVIEVLDKAY